MQNYKYAGQAKVCLNGYRGYEVHIKDFDLMDKLLDMKLHDVVTPNIENQNVQILRVPNGWIYSCYHDISHREGDLLYQATTTFVPETN